MYTDAQPFICSPLGFEKTMIESGNRNTFREDVCRNTFRKDLARLIKNKYQYSFPSAKREISRSVSCVYIYLWLCVFSD